ncbi:MAG: hypothetical protein HFE73_08960 [Firmicutes bacterium]|jgi:hypothetical protein|nr:hypothetical protein [Bacillota bacterium]
MKKKSKHRNKGRKLILFSTAAILLLAIVYWNPLSSLWSREISLDTGDTGQNPPVPPPI